MRILDLSVTPAGQFGGLLLAELGYDVIKVEPPSGDPLRTPGDDAPSHLLFDYLNRRKRSVVLDLDDEGGRERLAALCGTAAVVIEDFGPGGLEERGVSIGLLREANPDLVIVRVSPFGQEGPRRNWKANDFVLQAMGGVVWGTGWLGETPLKLPRHQAEVVAGLNAAIAALGSVYGIESGVESGATIDISIQEAFALQWTRQVTRYNYAGRPYRRETPGAGRQGFPHSLPARDGWIYMLAMRAEWEEFAFFLGLEKFITHEWSDPAVRAERWSEIEPEFLAAVASRDRYDWFMDASERGYTFAPIDDPVDVVKSPQLAARDYFREAELSNGERIPAPGLPFTMEAPLRPNRAPDLGEHTDEVLSTLGTVPAEGVRRA